MGVNTYFPESLLPHRGRFAAAGWSYRRRIVAAPSPHFTRIVAAWAAAWPPQMDPELYDCFRSPLRGRMPPHVGRHRRRTAAACCPHRRRMGCRIAAAHELRIVRVLPFAASWTVAPGYTPSYKCRGLNPPDRCCPGTCSKCSRPGRAGSTSNWSPRPSSSIGYKQEKL